MATDDQQSVTVLLRKCVVLAYQLKNDRLKAWATRELNGYTGLDEVPTYRVTAAPAKGCFSGPFGSSANNIQIPPAALEKEHQRFASEVDLTQAIKAYEELLTNSDGGSISIDWPPNLCLYYQQRIPNSKRLVLLSAYQEIAKSTIVELVDTVRNRVLNLALELKSEIGTTNQDFSLLTPQAKSQIDQTVVQQIFGGNVYVATGSATMNTHQQFIATGDWIQLLQVLKHSGLSQCETDELKVAVKLDDSQLGSNISNWIKKTAPKIVTGGIKLGAAVGQAVLTEYLKQYCGLT